MRPVAALPAPSFEDVQRSLPTPDPALTAIADQNAAAAGARQRSNAIDDLRQKIRPAPQDRLARMVDLNEERSAQILRKWAAATAEAS
jgi:flagellar M-ring protein FliF